MSAVPAFDRRTMLAGMAGLGCLAAGPEPAGYRVVRRATVDRLGEGVTWSPRRNALFWVDIQRPVLWTMHLRRRAVRSWPLPEPLCWIVERAGRDDFIVGLKRGFATLSLDPLRIAPIGSPEPDMPHNRLNDAKVDRRGRIWAGTMPDGGPGEGALYLLDPDLRWTRMDGGYRVANGPAFSRDGTTLYHADTPRRLVYAMIIGADGRLSGKRVFLRFGEGEGVPDGMTTDAAGGLWICHWDGGRVSRFLPDGTLDRAIRLPVSRPTSPCFAGPGAGRLFVASASIGREAEPLAGSLFEIGRPGVAGLPPTPFTG